MRIGLSAWSFSGLHPRAGRGPDPHSLEGLMELAARHGLAGVEGASDWFEAMSSSERRSLRRRLEAGGLALFLDTGSDDYASDISSLTRAVDLAAELGAPVVRDDRDPACSRGTAAPWADPGARSCCNPSWSP